MRRGTRLLVLLAFLVAVLSGTGSPCFAKPSQVQLLRDAEMLISGLVNEERTRFARDAGPLARNDMLDEMARNRSDAMARGASFSHNDKNGRFIAADMMRNQFGPYGVFGENILTAGGQRAFDPKAFAKQAVTYWMNSPGHRANILSPNYQRSGVGVVLRGGNAYVTQVFMGARRTK